MNSEGASKQSKLKNQERAFDIKMVDPVGSAGEYKQDASYMDKMVVAELEQSTSAMTQADHGKNGSSGYKYHSPLMKHRAGEIRHRFFAFAASLATWLIFRPVPAFAAALSFAPTLPLGGPTYSALPVLRKTLYGGLAVLLSAVTLGRLNGGAVREPAKKLYAVWSDSKTAEPGYSPELISVDSAKLLKNGATDLERLESMPYPGVDSMHKVMQYNVERMPEQPLLGTKVKGAYEWLTWR